MATPVFARCPAGCFARNYLSNSHGARCDAATNEQQAEQTEGKRGGQSWEIGADSGSEREQHTTDLGEKERCLS